jgi:hypothetical protein
MRKKTKTPFCWIFSSCAVAVLFTMNLFLALTLGILFVGGMTNNAQTIKTELVGRKTKTLVDRGNLVDSMFEISNLSFVSDGQVSELSTKIYPGYTISFDVAVVSSNAGQQIFVYTILDKQWNEVLCFSEERKATGENVFTKKIALPQDLPLGEYKLRVEAIVGDSSTIQEQYFYVEESPVVNLQANIKHKSAALLGRASLMITGSIFIFTLALLFVIIKHQKNSVKISKGRSF